MGDNIDYEIHARVQCYDNDVMLVSVLPYLDLT